MTRLPWHVRALVLLRSFMIQSSWNPGTMLGHGFAWALKPVLWWLDPAGGVRASALERHVEYFNAHPYLTLMGLGAVARLEADGVEPRRIRHFKTAVGGPLGALGDRLVWVGLLPTLALAAIAGAYAGVPPLWVTLGFLVLYNGVHLALRWWAWSAGYRHGADVTAAIREANLQGRAEGLSRSAAVVLGILIGSLLFRGAAGGHVWWVPVGGVLFLVGNRARGRGWRPALLATVGVVGLIALAGALVG